MLGPEHPDETQIGAIGFSRSGHLVSGPVGFVDATIIAMAERLQVSDIATIDFKVVGMMSPVCSLKPLRWVLQES